MPDQDLCSICGKCIENGQAIYTITGDHYDCKFPNGQKTLAELSAEFDTRVAGIKKLITQVEELLPTAPKKRSVASFYPRCEHCGCKLRRHYDDLEEHKPDCPNMPL